MKLSPQEVDDLDPETRNALWIMMKYEDEKLEHEQFKAQSKAAHKQ